LDLVSRAVIACAGALAALVLPSSCGGEASPPPSVVVVLVDELRKDSFDQWAARTRELASWGGVSFEQMRSVAPWTYPSVVTLLSGLYPQQHGADGADRANRLLRFSPEVPLVQQLLREAGYETAAFVANPFLREWNPLHVGFDVYQSDFVRYVGNRRPLYPEFADPERMFSPSLFREIRRHFDSRPLEAGEFTYVHYIDVHGPWDGAPFEPGYGNAVEYIDARIVELYEYFLERSQGNLLFFVTSDHGRALGDDVHVGYGPRWRVMKKSMHDFNLRIPFVVLPSPLVGGSGSVDVACSNVDFVPTLLDLLGFEVPVSLPGRSLAAYIRGERPQEDAHPVYARMSAFGVESDALVHEGRKYVRFFDIDTGKLREKRSFDLRSDPRETRSLGAGFGDAEGLLERAAGDRGLAFESTLELADDELEGQLRALGYLDGETAADPAPAPLVPAKPR
jgi:arylsulfatase A-like enzyme